MVLPGWSVPCDYQLDMNGVAPNVFGRIAKDDHRNDPALDVDGLIDFWPAHIAPDQDPALVIGALANFFPGREADAIDYFSTADDAATEVQAETPAEDELCESEHVFESGHIFQSDIQRAAMEFQRFAEKFHAFASECQQRGTV